MQGDVRPQLLAPVNDNLARLHHRVPRACLGDDIILQPQEHVSHQQVSGEQSRFQSLSQRVDEIESSPSKIKQSSPDVVSNPLPLELSSQQIPTILSSSTTRPSTQEEEVDSFLWGNYSDTALLGCDPPGHSSPRHLPPTTRSVLERCVAMASMRAWGDVLRLTNDALLGLDMDDGVAGCYSKMITLSSTYFRPEANNDKHRETCELILLRFTSQLKLRRYVNLGKDVEALGLLMSCCDVIPSWVPLGARIFAAQQIHYTDRSSRSTDVMFTIRYQAAWKEHWGAEGTAAIDNSLVNAFVRKREWRLALRSLDQMMDSLGIGAIKEVEWWCNQTSPSGEIVSDKERSQMKEVIMSAAHLELLSRQFLILLQSGAISAADEIQNSICYYVTKFNSQVDMSNMTALICMIKGSALTRQVSVRPGINKGLLLFARHNYTEAAKCFRGALEQQRQLDPIYFSLNPSYPNGCLTWKDLTSPMLGFDAEQSMTVECLNNLSLCHLFSGNMAFAVQELEGLIREDPCLYLTEALAFNICTLYELGLDREECARKKLLLQRVAKRFLLHDVCIESFRLN